VDSDKNADDDFCKWRDVAEIEEGFFVLFAIGFAVCVFFGLLFFTDAVAFGKGREFDDFFLFAIMVGIVPVAVAVAV